ncbi:TetR/AcrR family transcriptional regulator [Plantibacter sp. Mn2098]|uniref:TetR/AcrR family transcriptional regulator n=1 Tax=Plantibacter sp. Mn2098 TaxID=3395266 RepID=UPI003BC8EAD1
MARQSGLSDPDDGQATSGQAPAGRTTTDPRAERTRQTIFAAVGTLMAARAESVSVGDIVRTAGISRSSFYAHFSSLDELTTDFLRLQFSEIGTAGVEIHPGDLDDASGTGRSAARIGYRRLIAHLTDHFPLYSSVLDLPVARSTYDEIVTAYTNRMIASLVDTVSVPAGTRPELVAAYVAGGTLALVGAWMRGSIDVSDDELVDELIALLPPWLLASGT